MESYIEAFRKRFEPKPSGTPTLDSRREATRIKAKQAKQVAEKAEADEQAKQVAKKAEEAEQAANSTADPVFYLEELEIHCVRTPQWMCEHCAMMGRWDSVFNGLHRCLVCHRDPPEYIELEAQNTLYLTPHEFDGLKTNGYDTHAYNELVQIAARQEEEAEAREQELSPEDYDTDPADFENVYPDTDPEDFENYPQSDSNVTGESGNKEATEIQLWLNNIEAGFGTRFLKPFQDYGCTNLVHVAKLLQRDEAGWFFVSDNLQQLLEAPTARQLDEIFYAVQELFNDLSN